MVYIGSKNQLLVHHSPCSYSMYSHHNCMISCIFSNTVCGCNATVSPPRNPPESMDWYHWPMGSRVHRNLEQPDGFTQICMEILMGGNNLVASTECGAQSRI